jgi:hypothetical protein
MSDLRVHPQRTALLVIDLQKGTAADTLQHGHSFPRQNSSQQGVVTRYPTEPRTLAGRQKKKMKRREKGDEKHQNKDRILRDGLCRG